MGSSNSLIFVMISHKVNINVIIESIMIFIENIMYNALILSFPVCQAGRYSGLKLLMSARSLSPLHLLN